MAEPIKPQCPECEVIQQPLDRRNFIRVIAEHGVAAVAVGGLAAAAPRALLGQGATPETLAEFRHELGLDRPAYIRYFEWFFHAIRGDFGLALTNRRDILTSITPKFHNTLFLAGYAFSQLAVLAGQFEQPLADARLPLLIGQFLDAAGMVAVPFGPVSLGPGRALAFVPRYPRHSLSTLDAQAQNVRSKVLPQAHAAFKVSLTVGRKSTVFHRIRRAHQITPG